MQRGDGWKLVLTGLLIIIATYIIFPLNENIKLGLDLQGGTHLVLQVDKTKVPQHQRDDVVDRALEKIRNRIDQFGVSEPSISKQGEDRIVVQLPGVKDPQSAKLLIGKTAVLKFKLVDGTADIDEALKGNIPAGREVLFTRKDADGNTQALVLKSHVVLTGDEIENATVQFDQRNFNKPYVSLKFKPRGARVFARVTGAHVKERLAIILDDKIQSAPVIQQRISGGNAQITGNFALEEAKTLAIVLRTGSLPAPIKIIEERTVGPSLGRDSIRKGLLSIIVGFLLVVLFIIIYYKVSGFITVFALFLNLLLLLAVLGLFKATLTLPGIAGIILTIGMSVDANVLIFERIKEELKIGKTSRSAIDSGYSKAFVTIIDANLTTLITALILYQFGTGPIRGFAVTLSIGILASMYSAIIVTRIFMHMFNTKSKKVSI